MNFQGPNSSPHEWGVLVESTEEYCLTPLSVSIANTGSTPTVTFTGILSQSPVLTEPLWTTSWTDLLVTSPYALPGPLSGQMFYSSHR